MIQLNLLPDVKKEFLRAQSARRKTIAVSIMVSIIAAGVTVALAIYVYAVQNAILFVQTNDIKDKASKLSAVKDIDKYLVIQNQLAQLSSLHGEKHNFSRLLGFLPQLNPAPPKNISLTDLTVSAKENTITFQGTVKDYGALTTFKDTLVNATLTYQHDGQAHDKTKLFEDVTIETAGFQSTNQTPGVTFTVVAKYDPEVFKQDNTGVAVSVPNKETTGSVIGSPQAIFGGNQ